MVHVIPERIWTVPNARAEPSPAADPREARVRVEGLVCSACAARVERSLRRVPGVEAARVDLRTGVAAVRRRPDVPDAALEAAVRRAALLMPLRRLLAALGGAGPVRRLRGGKERAA
ncbi:MAG TPA: heavy metal-associated domain-containing protein [Dehalococcoidia bacterium]